MNSLELIAYNTGRQLDRFFDAFHAIPADKQDWAPNAASRSALDQLQEVAVVFQGIADAVTKRKLVMTEEDYANYSTERKKMTDPVELEKLTREGTERLIEFMKSVKEDELMDVVEMPWPGEFRVADLLGYHSWNMAYHEGQINYIANLLTEG